MKLLFQLFKNELYKFYVIFPSLIKNDSSPQIRLTQKALLNSFNTQKIKLQQVLFVASKDDIENIVNELFKSLER